MPELFNKISKQVMKLEIDEGALEEESKNNPEIFSVLRRHMIVKKPALKILTRKN